MLNVLASDGHEFQLTSTQAIELVFQGSGLFASVMAENASISIDEILLGRIRHLMSCFYLIKEDHCKENSRTSKIETNNINSSSANQGKDRIKGAQGSLSFPGLSLISTAELFNINKYKRLKEVGKPSK